MNCNDWKELIPAYIQGELDEKKKSDLKTHLKSCESCHLILEQTKELIEVMDNTAEVVPPPELKDHLLEALIEEKLKTVKSEFGFSLYKIAAAVALLIVGFGAGKLANSGNDQSEELAVLQNDIQSMKQLMMVSMLKEESASERIRAVASVEEFIEPSSEVIETLLATMNSDRSPNVRLAAIKALENFSSREEVKLALIKSFEFQDDPVIQICLINIMVDMEEKRAAKKFQELLDNETTQKIVKNQAEIGIQLLI